MLVRTYPEGVGACLALTPYAKREPFAKLINIRLTLALSLWKTQVSRRYHYAHQSVRSLRAQLMIFPSDSTAHKQLFRC